MKITKEDAETILAFYDGKQIQFIRSIDCEWRDTIGAPVWDFNCNQYRVKPEPKEIWVNEYKNEFISYREKHNAIKSASNYVIRVAVHYKEVIEEEEK